MIPGLGSMMVMELHVGDTVYPDSVYWRIPLEGRPIRGSQYCSRHGGTTSAALVTSHEQRGDWGATRAPFWQCFPWRPVAFLNTRLAGTGVASTLSTEDSCDFE